MRRDGNGRDERQGDLIGNDKTRTERKLIGPVQSRMDATGSEQNRKDFLWLIWISQTQRQKN